MGSLYIGDTEVISGGGGGGGGYCIFCNCSVGSWKTATLPAETRYIQNSNSSNYYTPVSLAGVDGNSRNLACACGSNLYGTICKLSDGTYSLCSSTGQSFYLIC